jgi:hypothetical protein
MNNPSDAQHFTINAMHGHDAGVWVCEGSGLGLSPVLFLQALCPDPAPRPLLIKWKQAVTPPKSFRSTGTLPLIYSEGGRLPPWPNYLHLFAPQVPIAKSFEQESGLQDWHLIVPVLGIIVIVDRQYDPLPGLFSWRGLKSSLTSSNPKRNPSLEWAQAQHLPLVIAALGYEESPLTRGQLRSRYGVTDDVVIVPGPVLSDVRRKASSQSSGMLASAFEPQQLTLDREYARHVMSVLHQQVVSFQHPTTRE